MMLMIRFIAIATAISSYIAVAISSYIALQGNLRAFLHSSYQNFYISAFLNISTFTYQRFYISALLHISTSTYRELSFPPLDQMILSTLGYDKVLFHMISHIKRFVCTYMTTISSIPVTIFFFSRMEL